MRLAALAASGVAALTISAGAFGQTPKAPPGFFGVVSQTHTLGDADFERMKQRSRRHRPRRASLAGGRSHPGARRLRVGRVRRDRRRRRPARGRGAAHRLHGAAMGLGDRAMPRPGERPVLDHASPHDVRPQPVAHLPRRGGRAIRATWQVLGAASRPSPTSRSAPGRSGTSPTRPGFFQPRPNPARYADLLRAASEAIRGQDASAQILIGGLFGYPLKGRDGGIRATEYLRELYAIPDISARPSTASPSTRTRAGSPASRARCAGSTRSSPRPATTRLRSG